MWGLPGSAGHLPDGRGYGGAPIDSRQQMGRYLGGPSFMQPYGAPYGLSLHLPWFFRQPSIFRSNRKRLNGCAIMINVLLPWLLFCIVFALLSFSYHYLHPTACWCIVTLLFLVTVVFFTIMWAVSNMKRDKAIEEEYTPMWYGFLAITCALAILSATLLGYLNFANHMSKVYDFENLATYRDVNPANYVGQQLVDAGRITFNNVTRLDIGKSMGFKDSELYCVAPIVSPETTLATPHDFWAVGTNCCSGIAADFHCKGYKDARSVGGFRLMDETTRPFYRLAVQQAEATYGIRTQKPLFFIWGPDPIQVTDDLRYAAVHMCGSSMLAALCVQCFLVVSATLLFAKIYPHRDEHFTKRFPYVF